jgi:hypothetical protein
MSISYAIGRFILSYLSTAETEDEVQRCLDVAMRWYDMDHYGYFNYRGDITSQRHKQATKVLTACNDAMEAMLCRLSGDIDDALFFEGEVDKVLVNNRIGV